MDRFGREFRLFTSDHRAFSVTTGSEEGYYYDWWDGEGVMHTDFQGYGYFLGTAYPDEYSMDFRLLDTTGWEQGALNATDLTQNNWAPIEVPWFGWPVLIQVSEANSGYTFTYHTSSQTLQGVTPTQMSVYNSTTSNWETGWWITASALSIENFWLTRDVDGASSPPGSVPPNLMSGQACLVDWTNAFGTVEPPPRNIQTITIRVGQGQDRDGHVLAVVHDDGWTNYLYVAPWNWYRSNYLTTYDGYGQSADYYYTDFLVEIDLNRSWTLVDFTANEDLGHTTEVMENYPPYIPPPPPPGERFTLTLSLPAARLNHNILVREDYANDLAPTISTDSAGNAIWSSLSITLLAGTAQEFTVDLPYYTASTSVLLGASVAVLDQTTGEMLDYGPPGVSHLDLSQWHLPPEPFTVFLSVTRWQHELLLCQANGESSPHQPRRPAGFLGAGRPKPPVVHQLPIFRRPHASSPRPRLVDL